MAGAGVGAAAFAASLAIALSARAEGAYYPRAWGPLGIGLLACLAFFAAYGMRLGGVHAAIAGTLVGLGGWTVASVAWGGLPQVAWTTLDRVLIAAAALLVGGALAGKGRGRLVVAGVLAGAVSQAAEILVRAASGTAPSTWFDGRMLEGPVGYHNAQALLCAVTIPLAVYAASAAPAVVRAAGAAVGPPLLAVLLLTQSRSALFAAALAVAAQVALARRPRAATVAGALALSVVVLGVQLRPVDRALMTGTPAEAVAALRAYVLATAALAVALAVLAALPAPRRRPRPNRRARIVAAALSLAAATAACAVLAPSLAPRVRAFAAGLPTDAPPSSAPGQTRFAAISLDGRRDAWRVAADLIRASPLSGIGAGRYAVRWGVDRSLPQLYILQPHSLELEVGAELGAPGMALLAAFLAAVALALRRALRRNRAVAAAAAGAMIALVAEASVDWTWSFPGIVAPVLLLVGAATAPDARERRERPYPVLVVAAVLSIGALAFPYVAAGRLADAEGAATPAGALADVRASLRLDPWDPDAVSAEGRLLESEGDFTAAAARYGVAARLSQRPWLEWFRRARALRRAGDLAGRVEACTLAQRSDPDEDALHTGPCGWPWLALHLPVARPPGPEGPARRWSDAG